MKNYEELYKKQKQEVKRLKKELGDLHSKYLDIYSYVLDHPIVKLKRRCDLWQEDFEKSIESLSKTTYAKGHTSHN